MTTSTQNQQPGGPGAAAETVVAVRGLSKVFKDFWGRPKARAVDNVDFEVRKGEVFGLLGPNGSGKSTTVKMLLGLLNPTKGHIEVFGHSPRHVATKARIGYLPEESYLYRYLDSAETLEFFGNLFQLGSSERQKRAVAEFLAPAREDRHDLVITHNFVISWFVREVFGAPAWRWLGMNQANCGLTIIRVRSAKPPVLVTYNDLGHLPAELRTGLPEEQPY